MNDIRRTILWVIFGFSMVLLWDQWQVYNGHKATFFPSPVSQQAAKAPAVATPASVPGGVSGAMATAATPAVPGAAPAAAGLMPAGAAPAAAREIIQISTDVLKLSFDSEGGSLVRAEMRQHVAGPGHEGDFVLLEQSPDRVYVAESGLIAPPTQAGVQYPNHKTPMTAVPGPRSLADGQNELVLRFESAEVGGVKLVKTYTLERGSYAIGVRHEVVNTGAVAVLPQLYVQLVRDGNKPQGESSFYSTFTGPAIYTEAKKYQKIDFKKIEDGKADFDKSTTHGYVTMAVSYTHLTLPTIYSV